MNLIRSINHEWILPISVFALIVVAIILIIVNVGQNANKKDGEKKEYTFIIAAVLLFGLAILLTYLFFNKGGGTRVI